MLVTQQRNETQTFLNAVCEQVRWKQAHETITRDLSDHIEDQTEAYVRGGMNSVDAAERAVKEMGDPVDVGLLMDASYRPRTEWAVLISVLFILLFGVVTQLIFYNAIPHYEMYNGENLAKLGVSVGIGGLLMVLAYNVNLYKLYKVSWAGYALICVSLIMRSMRDADGLGYQGNPNWIYFSLLTPIFLSGILYSLRGKEVWRLVAGNGICAIPFLYGLLWSGGYVISLLPCLVSCMVVLIGFLASGQFSHRWQRVILVSVLTWCISLLILTLNWQRLTINPFRYKQFASVIQRIVGSNYDNYGNGVREILAHAQVFGRGSLTPLSKELFFERIVWERPVNGLEWGFMVDYSITYLIYRFGWGVGLAAVAALLAVIAFGFSRCLQLTSQLGKMLCVSIMSVYAAQVLLYLLGCFGIYNFGAPFPLPFLSVGYRSQVVNMALLGMLLSLFRTDTLYMDTPPRKWQRLRLHVSADAGQKEK